MAGSTYYELVEILAVIRSSVRYSAAAPDYNLPQFAFVFAETLGWFAQGIRSGAWTYYEATSRERQNVMAAALRATAPPGFAEQYEFGMSHWQEANKIGAVDEWLAATEDSACEWLRTLIQKNRDAVIELTP